MLPSFLYLLPRPPRLGHVGEHLLRSLLLVLFRSELMVQTILHYIDHYLAISLSTNKKVENELQAVVQSYSKDTTNGVLLITVMSDGTRMTNV